MEIIRRKFTIHRKFTIPVNIKPLFACNLFFVGLMVLKQLQMTEDRLAEGLPDVRSHRKFGLMHIFALQALFLVCVNANSKASPFPGCAWLDCRVSTSTARGCCCHYAGVTATLENFCHHSCSAYVRILH